MLFISALIQHYTDGIITCIAHDLERKFPIRRMYDGSINERLLDGVEGNEAIFNKVERSLFGKKTCQRPSYMGEILDESPIKASMPQKTSNSLDICWGWQLFNHSIFVQSTSIPLSGTLRPRTIHSLTMK
jgi:hypothetical protein